MKHTLLLFLIFISSPCTAQWKNALFSDQVLAFGVHDTSLFVGEVPYTNLQPILFRFDPATPSLWIGSDTGISRNQGNVTSFASFGKYLFANVNNLFLYSSTNHGSNWEEDTVNPPIASSENYLFATSGFYNGSKVIYYIIRSRDSGKTWDSVMNILPSSFATKGSWIFANTGTAVWRSLDTGATWSQIHPLITGTITIMDSLLFIVGGNGQLAKSTDSGTDWSMVTVDSGSVPETVNCLATDGKNLFVGTPTGILVSTDTGKDWMFQNDSIAGIYQYPRTIEDVTQICVFDTFVFADVFYTPEPGRATSYYLMFRPISELTKPPDAVRQTPPGDTIEIYPNPATGMVTIFAGGTSILGVSILNVLGENVLDLADIRESDITLDISKLPSGTYFVRIETANGSVLRKVVIQQ